MIPLTLALSLQGRGNIIRPSPLRGEGWERVQNKYYFDTVNNTVSTGQKKLIE
jgi:hypothetical protein